MANLEKDFRHILLELNFLVYFVDFGGQHLVSKEMRSKNCNVLSFQVGTSKFFNVYTCNYTITNFQNQYDFVSLLCRFFDKLINLKEARKEKTKTF